MSAGWQGRGRCAGSQELFFDVTGEKPVDRQRREYAAWNLCADCPVFLQCREYALTYEDRWGTRIDGFWAGMNRQDISRVRSGLKATAKPNPDLGRPVTGPGRGAPGRPRVAIAHGTERGFKAHQSHGVDVCPECDQAHRDYQRDYRERRKARKKYLP